MIKKINTKKNYLKELKAKTIFGIGSLILREFLIKGITVFGQLFLIRLFTPNQFGTFAIIAFIAGLISLLSDVGLSQATIQRKTNLSQTMISTIFFTKQILTTFIVIVLLFCAPFLGVVYKQFNPQTILMLRVLALTYLLDPINSTILSLAERKLKFHIIPRVDIVGILVYYLTAILFALHGFGIWSLVIAVLFKEVVETIVLFLSLPWLPSLSLQIPLIRQMVRFGFYLQLGNVLGFFQRSMPVAVGGLVTSSYNVGLLDWSNNVSSFANTINENFGRVAFSGFSRIQDNKKLLALSIIKSMNYLLLYSILLTVVIFSQGRDIILYFATEKWISALPSLYWFIISVVFSSLLTPLVQGIIALGKSKEIILPPIIITVFSWILSFLLAKIIGFIALAIVYCLSVATLFVVFKFSAKKYGLVISVLPLLKAKFFILVSTSLFTVLLNIFLPTNILMLLTKLALILLFFCSSIFIFDKETFYELLGLIRLSLQKNSL